MGGIWLFTESNRIFFHSNPKPLGIQKYCFYTVIASVGNLGLSQCRGKSERVTTKVRGRLEF
jgi:succinate-acetate transporter protein